MRMLIITVSFTSAAESNNNKGVVFPGRVDRTCKTFERKVTVLAQAVD